MGTKGKLLTAITLMAVAATAVAGDAPSADAIQALTKDPAKMAEAQTKFSTICAACHGPQGAGLVGPNLTDNYWLKGDAPEQIFNSILIGAPAKGMPAMEPIVGGVEGVKMMAAYVLTIKGKNLPGKPPEGTEVKVAAK